MAHMFRYTQVSPAPQALAFAFSIEVAWNITGQLRNADKIPRVAGRINAKWQWAPWETQRHQTEIGRNLEWRNLEAPSSHGRRGECYTILSLPIHSRLHFGTPPESTIYTIPRFEFHQSFRREGKGWRLERRGDEKFAASLTTSFASGLASFGLVAVARSPLPLRQSDIAASQRPLSF